MYNISCSKCVNRMIKMVSIITETISWLVVFFITFIISSFLNVMLKTTKKKDWLKSLSFLLSLIFVGI